MFSSIGNHAHLTLTLALLLTSISLFEPVMGWIQILVICAVVMRGALYLSLQKHTPSIRTLNLLALLSAIVLAYFSLQLGVLLGMLNLLVLACALKLMLLRNNKDYYQLVTSIGFLIGCGFIFQQGIFFSLYYLCLVFLLLVSLALNQSPGLMLKKIATQMGVMGLQALPIAGLLFLVMPQLDPLWQMPSSKSSQTGLTENVTPGDIAELSKSTELAFRATFKDQVPPPSERYWRAIVLENFDGKTWKIDPLRKSTQRQYRSLNRQFTPNLDGDYYEYDVIAQPTHQNWLYAMDVATPLGLASQQKIWQSQDYLLVSKTPLVSRFQYSVRSYPDVLLNQSLFSLDRRINQQVPTTGNPRTVEWAGNLRQQYPADKNFIQAVLNYFANDSFTYTLQPPLMPNNGVDTFLFDQKAGFCSHYASAMAYVLRLGGIPARLVTGYQGGEMREQDYLSVYQYDAHAWVEAWYDETGWQRFDPTAQVAPNRIEFGLRSAISEQEFLLDSPFSLSRFSSIAWLNEIRLLLADIDYSWTKWILGFDQQTQKDLFKSILGELTPTRLALMGVGLCLTICLLLALFYLPAWRKPRLDPATKYLRQAESLLARKGLVRKPGQGPMDFADYVNKQVENDQYQAFSMLSKLYVSYLYQQNDVSRQAQISKELAYQLKCFKQALKGN